MAHPKRKRRLQKEETQAATYNNLDFVLIVPKTENQKKAFDSFNSSLERHIFLYGSAGTGKSFIALYLGLKQVLTGNTQFNKVIIVRNVVASRDMGFLPGSAKDKAKEYEAPYISICAELFGRRDAYELLKRKGVLEFVTTSFLRGTTFRDAIVIADEAQNFTAHEANTLMTRCGDHVRIMFAGDLKQSDLVVRHKYSEVSGLADFVKIIKLMKSFSFIEFNTDDIVRSKTVKEYLILRESLEDRGEIARLSSG